ncbi:histidine phosphatase family protein [Chelatococcus daeguensis]|uniref:histidine phosphatase family protein n=1 Tax=Chelatococcus daeguensis TaxID=444444 RepID=UPI0007AB2F62|nr:histidine phosphatase family protein [Chelatococcus daeguensis]KZE29357.1 hypothetical protein AVW15_06095 [Chelatococcus daeguensis]MBM3084095.1 histidine phosphatase family protein [Chelatococcus daeguensis]
MRLILIRHGETEWNAERRLQGHADAPLSERGMVQARRAAAFFAAEPAPGLVVSSDLGRARRTAEILGFPDAVTDPRLREMDLGDWTGRFIAEIEAEDRHAYRDWRLGTHTPPRGETWQAFRGRVGAAIADILARAPGDAVVVTHEGVVRATCDVLVGLAPQSLAPLVPGAVTVFAVNCAVSPAAARLLTFNYVSAPDDLKIRGLDHAPV